MLLPLLLNAENVREQFEQFVQTRKTFPDEPIPFVNYPSPSLPRSPIVILRTPSEPKSTNLKMPFPATRDSDESDCEVSTSTKVDMDVDAAKPKAPKIQKPEITFERISPTQYKLNEVAIKDGLRSNDVEIYTKYPGGKPIPAERFPSATPFTVFTLPAFTGAVDLVYKVEDFPASFVSFQDKQGERWKTVALWDNLAKKIIYVANVNAEIRLCSELYTGSSKGKVRWEKAVEPRNNIPSNFGSFAVSDRVLIERRKAHWPDALKKLRETCSTGVIEKKDNSIDDADKNSDTDKPKPKQRKNPAPKRLKDEGDATTAKPAPSRKRKADTYLQVTVSGKSRLVYTAASSDSLVVEEVTLAEGKSVARNIFSA